MKPDYETSRALTSNEGRFSRFTQGITEKYVIFSNDSKGVVTYVSPSVQSLLGFAPCDLVGRNWIDFANPDNPDHQRKINGHQAEGHRTEDHRTEGHRLDTHNWVVLDASGNKRVLEIQDIGSAGADGLDHCAIAREVAAPRKAESLSPPCAELEKQYETQIRQLESTLRKATSSEIFASFVHELMQPLTTIVNLGHVMCRQLKANHSCPEVVASVQTMVKSAQFAAGITKRLNRAFEGCDDKTVNGDLRSTIDETISMFAQEIQQGAVEIRFDDRSTTKQVSVDCILVKGVLLNLVRNALQALKEQHEGGVIHISTRPAGRFMEVVVADNGRGVREEKRQQLFSPSRSDKPGGMGIGLSICKSMVEMHGGKIWHSENKPNGAKFHFTLPLAESAD